MHNPLHVRTVCVALSPEDGSPLRAAMRQSCPRFVSLAGLSAHEARELRALQTDIVVDLHPLIFFPCLACICCAQLLMRVSADGSHGRRGPTCLPCAVLRTQIAMKGLWAGARAVH